MDKQMATIHRRMLPEEGGKETTSGKVRAHQDGKNGENMRLR